jgi:hypothetical protein
LSKSKKAVAKNGTTSSCKNANYGIMNKKIKKRENKFGGKRKS